MTRLGILVAPMLLAGCLKIALVDPAVTLATAQIEAWNRAGVDPISVSEDTRARMALACGTVSGLVAIARPNNDRAQRAILGFCEVAAKVAE